MEISLKYLLLHLLLSKTTWETWETRKFLKMNLKKSWLFQLRNTALCGDLFYLSLNNARWLSICILICFFSNFSIGLGWTMCKSICPKKLTIPNKDPFISLFLRLEAFLLQQFCVCIVHLTQGLALHFSCSSDMPDIIGILNYCSSDSSKPFNLLERSTHWYVKPAHRHWVFLICFK